MTNCIFCQIAKGEAPSATLYADELILAFLDIAPINPGHALIIPREHHASLTTVSRAALERMMTIAPRIGQAIVRTTGSDGFNLHLANGAVAGQIVMHSHLHVIPRHNADLFSWGWRSGRYDSDDARHNLAGKIRDRVERHAHPA